MFELSGIVGGKVYTDLVSFWGKEGGGGTVSIGRVCVLPFSTRQAIGGASRLAVVLCATFRFCFRIVIITTPS